MGWASTLTFESLAVKEKYPTLYAWSMFCIRLLLAYLVMQGIRYYCGDIEHPSYAPSLHSRVVKDAAQTYARKVVELESRNVPPDKYPLSLWFDLPSTQLFATYFAGIFVAITLVFLPDVKRRIDHVMQFFEGTYQPTPWTVITFVGLLGTMLVVVMYVARG